MASKAMYRCEDIMLILDVAENCAYTIIRKLNAEIAKTTIPGTNKKYAKPPRGRTPAKYFCEKYMLDKQECDEIIEKAG